MYLIMLVPGILRIVLLSSGGFPPHLRSIYSVHGASEGASLDCVFVLVFSSHLYSGVCAPFWCAAPCGAVHGCYMLLLVIGTNAVRRIPKGVGLVYGVRVVTAVAIKLTQICLY